VIEKIQIQNFQKHERLRIQFDKRITTIVGPSDTGKSSVMRALYWLAFNKPRGFWFLRNGAKSCSVKLWIDGHKLERRRSKSKNVYLLDGVELKAVGSDVPEEVQAVLNLKEENFQHQHDAPFWFSLTPGEVGKRLNAIIDLSIIDKSLTWLVSKVRRASTECDLLVEATERTKQELSDTEYVDEMTNDFNKVWNLNIDYEELCEKKQSLVETLQTTNVAEQNSVRTTQQADQAYSIAKKATSLERLSSRYTVLKEVIEDAKDLDERSRLPEYGFPRLEIAIKRARTALEKRNRLTQLISNCVAYQEKLKRAKEQSVSAERYLEERTQGVCPICGGKL
jgi:exonuclease SbcC